MTLSVWKCSFFTLFSLCFFLRELHSPKRFCEKFQWHIQRDKKGRKICHKIYKHFRAFCIEKEKKIRFQKFYYCTNFLQLLPATGIAHLEDFLIPFFSQKANLSEAIFCDESEKKY